MATSSIPLTLEVSAGRTDGAPTNGHNRHATEDEGMGSLFDIGARDDGRVHTFTRIERAEPIDEGTVGDLATDATEADIRRRWGGGTFRCIALDARRRIMTSATKRIAGDRKSVV